VLSTFVASDQPGTKGSAVELPPDFALRSVRLPEALVGKTLAEARLTQRLGIRVIEIKRAAAAGWEWIAPDAATQLAASDELVVLGPSAGVDTLASGGLGSERESIDG
jgi:uncharacterized protein with PhoU and TrkA domain